MSEQVLTKKEAGVERLCGKCGADIRAESQYCYHCGGVVGETETDVSEKQSSNRTFEAAANGSRSRTRRVVRKPKTVEVVWKRSDGPGYAFLFIALGIAAVVAAVLGIAYYLK